MVSGRAPNGWHGRQPAGVRRGPVGRPAVLRASGPRACDAAAAAALTRRLSASSSSTSSSGSSANDLSTCRAAPRAALTAAQRKPGAAQQAWRARLGGLQEHLIAVAAAVRGDCGREPAGRIAAREVHIDGRNLRQHRLRLPAVALRILDLQLAPLRPCAGHRRRRRVALRRWGRGGGGPGRLPGPCTTAAAGRACEVQQEVVERGRDARRHGLAEPGARDLRRAQPDEREAAVRGLQVVPHLPPCGPRPPH